MKGYDEHAERELELFIDNDARLYRQKEAIRTNLTRHLCRGNFSKDLAAKGFSYLTAEANRAYKKEFGTGFEPAARKEVDKSYVQEFTSDVKNFREAGTRVTKEMEKLLTSGKCKPFTLHGRRR